MHGNVQWTGETVNCEAHLERDAGTELTRPVTRRGVEAVRSQASRCLGLRRQRFEAKALTVDLERDR